MDGPTLGAPRPAVVSIKGGALPSSSTGHRSQAAHRMQQTYTSTTECILQNLSMTVGNPGARCYANAPWRAFTWTCALLQETHTEPWGNLQEAVQESMELAEAVDLHQLAGLQLEHPRGRQSLCQLSGTCHRRELCTTTSSNLSWSTTPTTGRRQPPCIAGRTSTMAGPTQASDNISWMTNRSWSATSPETHALME